MIYSCGHLTTILWNENTGKKMRNLHFKFGNGKLKRRMMFIKVAVYIRVYTSIILSEMLIE